MRININNNGSLPKDYKLVNRDMHEEEYVVG
jgi:hypothetical protein